MDEKLSTDVEVNQEGAGEKGEALVGVREAVEEALSPAIDTFILSITVAYFSGIDSSAIDNIEQLMQDIFDKSKEGSHQQSIALLLLKSVRLLRNDAGPSRITAIQQVAELLRSQNFTANNVVEADKILRDGGLDIVVGVEGLGELCGPDDEDTGSGNGDNDGQK